MGGIIYYCSARPLFISFSPTSDGTMIPRFESGIVAQLYYRHRHRCTADARYKCHYYRCRSLRSRDIANGKREHVAK